MSRIGNYKLDIYPLPQDMRGYVSCKTGLETLSVIAVCKIYSKDRCRISITQIMDTDCTGYQTHVTVTFTIAIRHFRDSHSQRGKHNGTSWPLPFSRQS